MVPSTDPHGFELDENLELTDPRAKEFIPASSKRRRGQAPATPFAFVHNVCNVFAHKQDHCCTPRTGSEDTTSSMQCNRGRDLYRNTGCYNNAISPRAAMTERNCPERIGKLFVSMGPEWGPPMRKEERA